MAIICAQVGQTIYTMLWQGRGDSLYPCVCISFGLLYVTVVYYLVNHLTAYRYGSVERFANFAHEGNHSRAKKDRCSSNKARYGLGKAAQQQMELSLRREEHEKYINEHLPPPPTKRQRVAAKKKDGAKPWAVRNLEAAPQYKQFAVQQPDEQNEAEEELMPEEFDFSLSGLDPETIETIMNTINNL
jgi:hypothetical protein